MSIYAMITRLIVLLCLTFIPVSNLLAQCVGAPVSGSIVTLQPEVCPGADITLTLTSAASGTDITYQWQSSNDRGTSWSVVNGATNLIYLYTAPSSFTTVQFRVAVTCTAAGLTSYSDALDITLPKLATYATLPFAESFDGDWIHTCTDGQLPQPQAAGTVWANLPATGNSSWRRNDNGAAANWDQDNVGAYRRGGSRGTWYSARFHSTYATAPGSLDLYVNNNTALAGKKLSFDYVNTDGTDSLRILLSEDGGKTFRRLMAFNTSSDWANQIVYFSSTSATSILRFMGVADNGDSDIGLDNLTVEEFAACSGTPVIGAAQVDNAVVCNGTTFKLGLTKLPDVAGGITWQWQSSIDGSNWISISGATDSVLTTAQNATTQYRLTALCAISNLQAISAAVTVSAPDPMSGHYFIDQSAATSGRTFASFTEACNALHCRGVSAPVVLEVALHGNAYLEQVLLDTVPGTSDVNTVTFKGNYNTLKFSSANYDNPAVFTIKTTDHVVVDSLIVDASPSVAEANVRFGFGILLTSHADFNVIEHCRIVTDSLTNDVRIAYLGIITDQYVSHNTFSDNRISGGYAGILCQRGATAMHILQNDIQQFYNAGCYLFNSTDYNDSLVIEGNNISNPFRVSDALTGLYVYGADDALLTGNRIHHLQAGSECTGITLAALNKAADAHGVVTNNLIFALGAPSLSGIRSQATDNLLLAHNTISLGYTATTNGAAIEGIYVSATAVTNSSVKDNIISIDGYGKGSNHALRLSDALPGLQLDYNDYLVSGDAANAVAMSGLTTSTTLMSWQMQSGREAHSVVTDPVFEDVATGDYRPTSSVLDNEGTGVGVATDIEGVVRNLETPDMGAYEYKAPACAPLHTGTYFIDARVATGTDKTYTSFNDAYRAMKCGIDGPVVFEVAVGSGSYTEQLNMAPITGASAINTVTFKGHGETIRYSSADEMHRAVIRLNKASHIVFDSLVIDATPPADDAVNRWGYGVQLFNDADSNRFHGCTILTDSIAEHFNDGRQEGYIAIALMGNSDSDPIGLDRNVFDGNNISGGYYSIYLPGKATGDSIIDNNITGFNTYGIILQWRYTPDYCDSLVVQGNNIWHTNTALVGIRVCYANNTVIAKNRIHTLKYQAVDAIDFINGNNTPESRTYITDNLIYDIGPDASFTGPSYFFNGINTASPGNTFVLHNTVVLDNVTSYVNSFVDPLYLYGLVAAANKDTVNTVFENNLVSITGGGTGHGHAVGVFSLPLGATPSVLKMDYNDYYIDDNPLNQTARLINNYAATLSDWQGLYGKDTHSVDIVPLFKDTANGNYLPTNKSLDNLGTPVDVATDIVNILRSQTHPDMGAYEIVSCPETLAGFGWSNNPVCKGEPVSFSGTATSDQAVISWHWDFGNGDTAVVQAPEVVFKDTGSYHVRLRVATALDCVADTLKTIVVADCEKQLFIPGAFTPNGDGLNDVLRVYGNGIKSMQLMVFNQWGEKLFESRELTMGWDGTYKGRLQPTGVYMYVCKTVMSDGSERIKKGAINLIR